VTIAWASARPDEEPPAEPLAEEAEPALGLEPEVVLLELLELQAASVTAAAIAPPDASRRFHLCVIAYAFHPTVHAGSVNASFLLGYSCTMAKP
jgi:hypothetical protein